jgi:hypothetical protein
MKLIHHILRLKSVVFIENDRLNPIVGAGRWIGGVGKKVFQDRKKIVCAPQRLWEYAVLKKAL